MMHCEKTRKAGKAVAVLSLVLVAVLFAFATSAHSDAANGDVELSQTATLNSECGCGCVIADGIVYTLSGTEATVTNPPDHPRGSSPTDSTYAGDIKIPESIVYDDTTYTVTTIGSAFGVSSPEYSKVTSITLPSTITTIKQGAFNNCAGLTTLAIPTSVTSIGEGAFAGCSGLTTLEIPAGVRDLGFKYITNASAGTTAYGEANYIGLVFGSLAGWDNAKNVTFAEDSPYTNDYGILYKGTVLVACLDPEITSVNVREGTTEISTSAFLNCTKLANVTLPEGLETIGDDAFNLVPGVDILDSITIPGFGSMSVSVPDPADVLVKMNIPSSVTSIGANFLKGALKADGTSVLVMEGTTAPSIGTGMFATESGKTATLNIYYPTDAQNAYNDLFGTYLKTENAYSLSAETSVNLNKGDSSDISITSQTPAGFTVSAAIDDSSIASINLIENTLSIRGLGDGSTTITLKISDGTTTLIETAISVTVITITYTVSFDSNGGTGSMNPVTVEAGTSYTVPGCGFTKDGFEFSGWNTASGTPYQPGDNITLSDNLVLFAVWESTQTGDDGTITTVEESTTTEGNTTTTTTTTTVEDSNGNTLSTEIKIESTTDDTTITSTATILDSAVEVVVEAPTDTSLKEISANIDKMNESLPDSSTPVLEITIKNDTVGGSVTLGTDVLNNLIDEAGSGTSDSGTPSIIIDDSDDAKLEQAQIAAKGDDVGFELTALITYDDGKTTVVSQLGGTVTVRLPYVSGTMGGDPEDLGVWYIDDYGNRVFMESVYDSVDKCFVFETNHFSLYVISEIPGTIEPDNPPFNPGWDDDDYVPIPPVIVQESGDDDSTKVVACAAAAVVAALMACFLVVEYRKR